LPGGSQTGLDGAFRDVQQLGDPPHRLVEDLVEDEAFALVRRQSTQCLLDRCPIDGGVGGVRVR
jgi:hypothetical protein